MNTNRIVTDGWSNGESRRLYETRWPNEPAIAIAYGEGMQCGGCSYFAPLNSDWGICANARSRHRLETVFEHFSCPSYVAEGWDKHSFSDHPEAD